MAQKAKLDRNYKEARSISQDCQETLEIDPVRAKSGIPGFDELVMGGLMRNRVYLVSGPAGAGKTILSLQFLYNGAVKYGENGVYVTFETSPEQLRRDIANLGWELGKLEDAGELILIDASSSKVGLGTSEKYVVPRPVTLDAILYEIYNSVQKINAKRVVLDCLDAMELRSKSEEEFRGSLLKLVAMLKSFDCTSILVAEAPDEQKLSRSNIESFLADGVIRLHHIKDRDRRFRKIEILKLRGSSHSSKVSTFEVGDKGVEINTEAEFENLVKDMRFQTRGGGEGDRWLKALRLEEEGDFASACEIYLEEAKFQERKKAYARAALCYASAAKCKFLLGERELALALYKAAGDMSRED